MIELLDFNLPTTANPTFAVPVTAQPQALYLRTVGMTGTTPQAHLYDGWGFWAVGTAGTNHMAQGVYVGDGSAPSNTISIGSNAHILRLENATAAQLGVAVAAVSGTQITLNCTGTLLTGGNRVIGLAFSGFGDAWCGSKQLSLPYPMPFNAGFQPDFAMITQLGARTENIALSSNNSGIQSFGVMNTTKQAAVTLYQDVGQHNKSSTMASEVNCSMWQARDILYEEFFGAFTATGVNIDNRSGNDTVSSIQTIAMLCLKGVSSDIFTGLTPAGTATHNLSITPEAGTVFGSGNTAWETRQAHDVTTAWNQASHALTTPAATPPASSMHTGTGSGNTAIKHRNNEDGACWGYLAGTTPTNATPQYRGAVSDFDATAMKIDFTLNGTGVPTGSYPYIACAMGTAGTGPPIGSGLPVPFGL